MTAKKYRFVQVTHTFLLDEKQARKAVAVARALCMDRVSSHFDAPDEPALEVIGEDFLTPEGQPDLVSALTEVPWPEAMVGAEPVESTAYELDEMEIARVTRHWPEDWAEQRERENDD